MVAAPQYAACASRSPVIRAQCKMRDCEPHCRITGYASPMEGNRSYRIYCLALAPCNGAGAIGYVYCCFMTAALKTAPRKLRASP